MLKLFYTNKKIIQVSVLKLITAYNKIQSLVERKHLANFKGFIEYGFQAISVHNARYCM